MKTKSKKIIKPKVKKQTKTKQNNIDELIEKTSSSKEKQIVTMNLDDFVNNNFF